MTIQKGDFVTVDYTGYTMDGLVFDTTQKEVAQKEGLSTERCKSATIVVGQGHLLAGLDEAIDGAQPGAHIETVVDAEKAFGKKDASKIQLMPLSKFKQAKMDPQVGMQITVDNQMGVVKRVGGGRVLVDFNHMLAGQQVRYTIDVREMVTDVEKKVNALLERQGLNMKGTVTGDTVTLQVPTEVPDEIKPIFSEPITKFIPEIKSIEFKVSEPPKDAEGSDKAADK